MDLTEGLILSSMMGDGSGSGSGGGNPGYSVVTETVTIIPQQTVTMEENEGVYGALVTVTIPEGMDAPPEQFQVVFDGVTYLCSYDDESGSFGAPIDQDTGLITDWSEYPFTIITEGPNSPMMTQTGGSHAVKADMIATQLVIDPEFEEAVNTVVGDGGGSGGSSESELPDYSSSPSTVLAVDSRGDSIRWSDLAYTESGSAGLYKKQRNYYTKNAVISVYGSIANIKQNITAGWFSGMKSGTSATLALYSTNGLELVYEINPTNNPTLIYDKGTESPGSVTVQGDVVIVTNS